MTLAWFPLHRDNTPSSFRILPQQSLIPRYGLVRCPLFSISPWFCSNSFTRSIGAAPLFATTAAAPPITKSAAIFSEVLFPASISTSLPLPLHERSPRGDGRKPLCLKFSGGQGTWKGMKISDPRKKREAEEDDLPRSQISLRPWSSATLRLLFIFYTSNIVSKQNRPSSPSS